MASAPQKHAVGNTSVRRHSVIEKLVSIGTFIAPNFETSKLTATLHRVHHQTVRCRVHSSARKIEDRGRVNLVSALQSAEKLVDMARLELATPCLQSVN